MCKNAKETLDKLEVAREWTNQVKESTTFLCINKNFYISDTEMFTRFTDNANSLKALDRNMPSR